MTGSGKSTLAKRLAKKYGLRYLSGGETLKSLAVEAGYKPAGRGWWETGEGRMFLERRTSDPKFDRRVDEELIKEAEVGNVVLDSWTMPWLIEKGFKVWLDASPQVRARRVAERDGTSLEEASIALIEKDKRTRRIYKKLYGFDLGKDFTPFVVVLDTSELSVEEVYQTLCLITEHLLIKR